MSKFKKFGSIVVLVAIIAAFGISSAFAQEATPSAPAAPLMHGGRGIGDQAALEAAAAALGMSADELSTQLWGGKTLAQVAEEAGVDLQDVRDAVEAARIEATRAGIEQAVTDGNITRAQADWLLEGLDNGYWGGANGGFGRGFGRGFGPGRGGFHGPRGFGGFSAPNSNGAPTDTSGA